MAYLCALLVFFDFLKQKEVIWVNPLCIVLETFYKAWQAGAQPQRVLIEVDYVPHLRRNVWPVCAARGKVQCLHRYCLEGQLDVGVQVVIMLRATVAPCGVCLSATA